MLYVSTEANLRELLSSGEPLVVGCYSDWCPASSMAKPVFERVAEMRPQVRFCKVRTDMAPRVASLLRVEAIPSFYLLRDAEIVGLLRGAVPEEALLAWVDEGISKLKGRRPA